MRKKCDATGRAPGTELGAEPDTEQGTRPGTEPGTELGMEPGTEPSRDRYRAKHRTMYRARHCQIHLCLSWIHSTWMGSACSHQDPGCVLTCSHNTHIQSKHMSVNVS